MFAGMNVENRPAARVPGLSAVKSWLPGILRRREPLVPVLRFTGAIGMATPLRPGLSLVTTAASIERAFSLKRAKAVAVQINSPGGSAVQSMLIYKRLRALAEERELPIYVFVEDVAASGGYMIACAGDEIYADPSSIVGSIGVISAMFGLDKMIEKIGVERRVHTAGRNKMSLDPFQPEKPEDVERLKSMQLEIHETFIDLVKTSRGARIDESPVDLFTGEYWTGNRAKEFGLIDGVGDLRAVMREKFGPKVRLKLVTPPRGWFRLGGSPGAPGSHMGWPSGLLASGPTLAEDAISALEARALWARYGF